MFRQARSWRTLLPVLSLVLVVAGCSTTGSDDATHSGGAAGSAVDKAPQTTSVAKQSLEATGAVSGAALHPTAVPTEIGATTNPGADEVSETTVAKDAGQPPTVAKEQPGATSSKDAGQPPTVAKEQPGATSSKDAGQPPTVAKDNPGATKSKASGEGGTVAKDNPRATKSKDAEQPATVAKDTSRTETISKEQEQPMPSVDKSSGSQSSGAPNAPGQAPGGGAEGPQQQPGGPPAAATGAPANWKSYADPRFRFRVLYPPHLEVKQLSDGERGQSSPSPLAAVQFYDQGSELAAIAPPPFAVYVFENAAGSSLEDWLRSAGLLGRQDQVVEAHHGKHVSGVRVSSTDFMAPGTAVYIARGRFVFRLIPVGQEGEAILDLFALE